MTRFLLSICRLDSVILFYSFCLNILMYLRQLIILNGLHDRPTRMSQNSMGRSALETQANEGGVHAVCYFAFLQFNH